MLVDTTNLTIWAKYSEFGKSKKCILDPYPVSCLILRRHLHDILSDLTNSNGTKTDVGHHSGVALMQIRQTTSLSQCHHKLWTSSPTKSERTINAKILHLSDSAWACGQAPQNIRWRWLSIIGKPAQTTSCCRPAVSASSSWWATSPLSIHSQARLT